MFVKDTKTLLLSMATNSSAEAVGKEDTITSHISPKQQHATNLHLRSSSKSRILDDEGNTSSTEDEVPNSSTTDASEEDETEYELGMSPPKKKVGRKKSKGNAKTRKFTLPGTPIFSTKPTASEETTSKGGDFR